MNYYNEIKEEINMSLNIVQIKEYITLIMN